MHPTEWRKEDSNNDNPIMSLPLTLIFVVMTTALPVNRRRSCGSQLADILSLVCAGRGYNTPYSFDGEQTEPSTPSKSGRVSRGITHECCKVGCSWKTMEEYCLPGETENKIFGVESLLNQIQTDDSSKVSPREKNYDRSSPKKAKGHRKKKKKGRKGNGRCRCRRKQRKRLAIEAYPQFNPESRDELVRNQLIQCKEDSDIRLALRRDQGGHLARDPPRKKVGPSLVGQNRGEGTRLVTTEDTSLESQTNSINPTDLNKGGDSVATSTDCKQSGRGERCPYSYNWTSLPPLVFVKTEGLVAHSCSQPRSFDPEKIEQMLKDAPVIEIGTVPPPYLGQPVILPRVKRSSTTSRGTFLRKQEYMIANLPHPF
uniref:Insulin-like domain-containing protein n=1 Tax=Timema douglasi TaxID=61478 RepID=A0A7R8VLI7_TIMDO|nr:unnamed protein product [Timema douglasi]